MTKLSLSKRRQLAKEILNRISPNEVIEKRTQDFYSLIELFKEHPAIEEKMQHGCKGFIKNINSEWGNNYSFAVLGNLDEVTTISMNFSLTDNVTSNNTRAFRTAIRKEISDKKLSFIAGETKCEISGIIIKNYYDLHIDHHDHEFHYILNAFLLFNYLILEDIKVKKEGTMYFLVDKELESKFIEFHNDNTTLRFTHKYYNLRK